MNKKGQVAKTVTWIVATIIIIVILGITLFVADITWGGSKDVRQTKQVDFLASQSFFSYLLTPVGEGNVYLQIQSDFEEDLYQALNEDAGNLALSIFRVFYGEEYKGVWIGVALDDKGLTSLSNEYFEVRGRGFSTGVSTTSRNPLTSVSERVYFDRPRNIEMALFPFGLE